MDIGDGLWSVGMGAAMILVTGAELAVLLTLGCGIFMRWRGRVYLALQAVAFLVVAHWAILAEGVGIWRKVFLGVDPEGDRSWLADGYDHTDCPPVGWLAFNVVCHVLVLHCAARWWRASRRSVQVLKQ